MLRQKQRIAVWKLQDIFLRQDRPKVWDCEWHRQSPGTAVGSFHQLTGLAASPYPGIKPPQGLQPRRLQAESFSCPSIFTVKQTSSSSLWSSSEGTCLYLARFFNTVHCWEPPTLLGSIHCLGYPHLPFVLTCVNWSLSSHSRGPFGFWQCKAEI